MTSPGGRLTAWWLRAEPHVMGRSAVANAVGWLTIPAVVQLSGYATVSQSLKLAGPDGLSQTWAVGIVLSAAIMAVVYLVRDPEAQRVLEVLALVLIVACCAVLAVAIAEATGVLGLIAGCLSMALATACVGRGVLLVRQIVTATALARQVRRARDAHRTGGGGA